MATTHHQKTLLIDYAWQEGEKAVGYVMGLNATTDYWDSGEHCFDTPRRETDWARKSETAKASKDRAISRDPYRDYACRLRGPALRDVQRNFVKAWARAGGQTRPDDADKEPAKLREAASPGSRVQIVRTQPQENSEKSIKRLYWQASSFARNYLYIENQYFYYERWVRHLKAMRAAFMQGVQRAGVAQKDGKLLHLIAVIPWPEDDGMVPRTYDMVKSLGEANSMPGQHKSMEARAKVMEAKEKQWERWQKLTADPQRMAPEGGGMAPRSDGMVTSLGNRKPILDPLYDSASKVQAPIKDDEGELEGLGMKVLLARLVTQNQGKPMPKPEQDYRQIYIHSKLMLIDDAFFTLGSANLNVRSMAADSELNMGTDDHKKAKALRQEIWRALAGRFEKSDGGEGGPEATAAAFESWQDVMKDNLKAVEGGQRAPITGHIIPFIDKRQINFRHG